MFTDAASAPTPPQNCLSALGRRHGRTFLIYAISEITGVYCAELIQTWQETNSWPGIGIKREHPNMGRYRRRNPPWTPPPLTDTSLLGHLS